MMVTEEFIKRIEMLLDYFSLSTSAFADKIGVQRSGISHLLSGRNKPSLDFILKVRTAFPEVNLYWLLNGLGNIISEDNVSKEPYVKNDLPKQNVGLAQNIKTEKRNGPEVSKIVVLYADGTFLEYSPKKS